MDKRKVHWWQWPSWHETRLKPWYTILRREAFVPLYLLGLSLSLLAVLCAMGIKDAKKHLRDSLTNERTQLREKE